jgi:Flp pilus assembly protein TadG
MTRVRPKLSRGQALIETAVTVLLLVLTTFTIFDFARFFWAVLAVQNGVAQGTRFAVTNRELGELDRDESIRRAIREATPGFTIADDDIIFFNVSAGATGSSGNPGDTIRVTVEQDFRFLTPVLAEVFGDGGELRFAASSTMRNEPEAD